MNTIIEKLDKYLSINKVLNQDIFDGDKLKPTIRKKIEEISEEFIKYLKIDIKPDDIILTGSNAGYNYTAESDIDIHIIVDFSKINGNPTLVQEFFLAKKCIWNEHRDILIKGHDVELYAQGKNEELVSSGVYSIVNDKWVNKPVYQEHNIDEEAINKKVEQLHYEINNGIEDNNIDRLTKIKDKLKKLRKSGLHKGGEFSVENLTFKVLRNDGTIEKLMNGINKLYDKQLSLEAIQGLNMSGSYQGYGNIG
jgi:predicted nucleotidyltransferase